MPVRPSLTAVISWKISRRSAVALADLRRHAQGDADVLALDVLAGGEAVGGVVVRRGVDAGRRLHAARDDRDVVADLDLRLFVVEVRMCGAERMLVPFTDGAGADQALDQGRTGSRIAAPRRRSVAGEFVGGSAAIRSSSTPPVVSPSLAAQHGVGEAADHVLVLPPLMMRTRPLKPRSIESVTSTSMISASTSTAALDVELRDHPRERREALLARLDESEFVGGSAVTVTPPASSLIERAQRLRRARAGPAERRRCAADARREAAARVGAAGLAAISAARSCAPAPRRPRT